MRLLFLDIDGVLNGHQKVIPGSLYCGIRRDCVERLNRIIESTDCQLVISSAWRYMILGGAMTLKGFEYFLLTHGVDCHERVHGHTVSDELYDRREHQILHYLAQFPERPAWCVLDDDPMGMSFGANQWRLVRTDGTKGLTTEDADRLIAILKWGE